MIANPRTGTMFTSTLTLLARGTVKAAATSAPHSTLTIQKTIVQDTGLNR